MKYLRILVLALFVACAITPSTAAPTVKEWTWLVFLNADNNLDSYGVADQLEMAKVGSNDFLNIISLIDRENGPATLNYIEKGNVKKLKDMGELDMGNYKQLVKFVKDMAAAYPAKHYAVIIWNHGSGWEKSKLQAIKGISYDDSTGNHITTGQLGLAFGEIKKALGRNVDVFAMDACLMAMVEIAYAVKDDVDIVVASEETEPGDGFPYDDMLKGLKKGMDAPTFAQHLVKAYVASYDGGSQGSSDTTQSAIVCAKLGSLRDAIEGFAKAAIAGNFAKEFSAALNSVQTFYISDNIDLTHFVSLLKSSISDAGFQTAVNKLQTALGEAILAHPNCGASMQNAFGIAIYCPSSSYSFSSDYNGLAFAKDSQWEEMIQDFYKKNTSVIVSGVENGDISSLIGYVKTANANNREVSAHLTSKLNVRLFSEGGLSTSIKNSVKNLLNELKSK